MSIVGARRTYAFQWFLRSAEVDHAPLRIRTRVGGLAAARPRRLVEQRLADASPLLDVFQKALLDEMLVNRHTAQPFALGDFRPEYETPMLENRVR